MADTTTYPYAMHVGLKPASIDEAREVIDTYYGLPFYVDGDGWNSWGEAPGTDVNDPDTLAVTVFVRTLPEAIALAQRAVAEYRDLLVPSDPTEHGGNPVHYITGVLAVVSQSADYAEQFFIITTTGQRTLANQHVI